MDAPFLNGRSPVAVSVGVGPALLGLLAAVLVAAALLVARRRARLRARPQSDSWEHQLRLVCDEARSVIDELQPQQAAVELPATAVLSAIAVRLRQLDEPLAQLVREAPPRASESAEEIGQVSRALQVALEAERKRRLTIPHGRLQQRAMSNQLVIDRIIELEMVVEVAIGLLTEDRRR